MAKVRETPILLHAHVPKTAGESFVDFLVCNFGMRAYRYEHPDVNFVLSPPALETLLFDRPELIAFSSHNVRTFSPVLANRPALYFTMLRSPTDTFVSLLKYVRRNFLQFSPQVQALWPRDTPDCSLQKLAEHALFQAGPQGQFSFQTRFFCHPKYVDVPLGYDMNEYGVNSYILASGCLDRFFVVGIVEEIECTMEILSAKLEKAGIPLRSPFIEHINATKVQEDELDWLRENDCVGREVLSGNINDWRLYERYKKRLAAEYQGLKNGRLFLNGLFGGSSFDSNSQNDVASLAEPALETEAVQTERAMQEFCTWNYGRINQRRIEHLASLQLDFDGKSVWEVSAGIGDLSSFFIDRNTDLTITEVRSVLLTILRDRYQALRIEELDLEIPNPHFERIFDLIICYGCLYHVRNPDQAIAFMAERCSEMLIIESCVSFGDTIDVNLVEEDSNAFSQAYHGIGCRPTRRYIFQELSKHFPYVYVTAEQPRHEQFPLDWDSVPPAGGLSRSIFVATRKAMEHPKLLAYLPQKQSYMP